MFLFGQLMTPIYCASFCQLLLTVLFVEPTLIQACFQLSFEVGYKELGHKQCSLGHNSSGLVVDHQILPRYPNVFQASNVRDPMSPWGRRTNGVILDTLRTLTETRRPMVTHYVSCSGSQSAMVVQGVCSIWMGNRGECVGYQEEMSSILIIT